MIPSVEYLADGLTEETSASLGQIDPAHVHRQGPHPAYKGTTKSRRGDRHRSSRSTISSRARCVRRAVVLRVTANLDARARSGTGLVRVLRSRAHELLGLQQEMSAAIAEPDSPAPIAGTAERPGAAADRGALTPTISIFVAATFANQRTAATSPRAIDYLTSGRRPRSELCAGVGRAVARRWRRARSTATPAAGRHRRAREAALRAVRADPQLARRRLHSAYVLWTFELGLAGGRACHAQAMALDPGFASGHMSLGHALSQMGQHAEAGRDDASRAQALDPSRSDDPCAVVAGGVPGARLSIGRRVSRRPHDRSRRGVLDRPHHARPGVMQLGQTDGALEALMTAGRFSGQNSKALSFRGLPAREGGAGGRGSRFAPHPRGRLAKAIRPAVRDGVRHARPRRRGRDVRVARRRSPCTTSI